MTLRRCTRHELCSTSTEQTGITRSANWAEWKVAGGRLDRGIEESQECDVCWQDKSVDSWSHVTQWKPFAALLLLTQGNKSHIYMFRRNMASHQRDSKSRTLVGNHIQFLHRHHYQSTRQYDSILKTCLKWVLSHFKQVFRMCCRRTPGLPSHARPAVGHASFSCLWSRLYLCFNFQRECYFQAVHDAAFRVIMM